MNGRGFNWIVGLVRMPPSWPCLRLICPTHEGLLGDESLPMFILEMRRARSADDGASSRSSNDELARRGARYSARGGGGHTCNMFSFSVEDGLGVRYPTTIVKLFRGVMRFGSDNGYLCQCVAALSCTRRRKLTCLIHLASLCGWHSDTFFFPRCQNIPTSDFLLNVHYEIKTDLPYSR